MVQNALDKKSNLDYLEKEIGWQRFLPKYFIEAMKVTLFTWTHEHIPQ